MSRNPNNQSYGYYGLDDNISPEEDALLESRVFWVDFRAENVTYEDRENLKNFLRDIGFKIIAQGAGLDAMSNLSWNVKAERITQLMKQEFLESLEGFSLNGFVVTHVIQKRNPGDFPDIGEGLWRFFYSS